MNGAINLSRLLSAILLSLLFHLIVIFGAADEFSASVNRGGSAFRPSQEIAAIDLTWVNNPSLAPLTTNTPVRRQEINATASNPPSTSNTPLTREPELIAESIEEEISFSNLVVDHGELVLQIFLDRLGVATSVRTLKSTMPREIEGQIVRKFYLAKYRPGEQSGVPVMSSITMSIQLSSETEQPAEEKEPVRHQEPL